MGHQNQSNSGARIQERAQAILDHEYYGKFEDPYNGFSLPPKSFGEQLLTIQDSGYDLPDCTRFHTFLGKLAASGVGAVSTQEKQDFSRNILPIMAEHKTCDEHTRNIAQISASPNDLDIRKTRNQKRTGKLIDLLRGSAAEQKSRADRPDTDPTEEIRKKARQSESSQADADYYGSGVRNNELIVKEIRILALQMGLSLTEPRREK